MFLNLIQNVRSNLDKKQEKQMLKELDIFMRENTCPHIVQFYGILFQVVIRFQINL